MIELGIELEDSFSDNDRYLVKEHLKNGTDDFLLTGLGSKTFVVPYKYRKAAKNEADAVARFKDVLLDFQTAEVNKYKEAGLPVRGMRVEGVDYVMPYDYREKRVSSRALADYVEERAAAKYNMIIETCRELEKRGVRLSDIDFSMAALAKYQHYMDKACKQEEQNARRVQSFCNKAKGKTSKKFNLSMAEIARQAGMLADRAAAFVKRRKLILGVSAVIGLGTIGVNLLPQSCTEKEPVKKVLTTNTPIYTGKYVDFRGVEHSDTLGNIARIMDMKAEISAMLISVEGYADKAYKDGKGVLTIGSGTTFYLDDTGNISRVREGDETTPEKAMNDKWRFIEAEMLELLGDKLGRACSGRELMATIGAGFCWGKNALEDSEYYKALRAGESEGKLSRKLTGFRKQKGLLKREYLLSACLEGKWTPKDLLDMPIYKYKGQYIGCSVYRLDLGDIMPCRQDKKGNLLKDRQGHHIPIIGKDDFGTFYDNADEIKQKLQNDAKYSLVSVKQVRDFMPKEMIKSINMRAENVDFAMMVQKNGAER